MPAKHGPKSFLSDEEILAEIRAVPASNLFVGEVHRKVWARLFQERGVRTSMRRVLRIMREKAILACNRPTGVRGPETHDRTVTTKTPDEIWAIDATGCLIDEGKAAVFVVVDHCTGAHSLGRPREFQLQIVSETGLRYTADQGDGLRVPKPAPFPQRGPLPPRGAGPLPESRLSPHCFLKRHLLIIDSADAGNTCTSHWHVSLQRALSNLTIAVE